MKEVKYLPTTQQAFQCFQLCQNLTNMYLSVDMVRLDARTGNAIILTGEEILIEIYPNGNWRFVNEI
ncbi:MULTISPECIES: DUF6888 family protein [unclassified Spirulina]|uniref:DUF6888 family protein n=1 Tax=unclassified Spirulina TaxID=2684457 RepID=UPI00194FB820|nr:MULTISPECIES: hypothetical protein [Spirulina]MEA5468785.1 hypothetical protein [Spirulina sp. 06S082]